MLHGGLTQAKREQSLSSFRHGSRFLIATNIAARGLDIADITDIINFDAPDTPYDYVHRVGRSARMGKEGRAFTILGLDERDLLRAIQREANIRMEELHPNLDKYNDFELPAHGRRQPNRGDRAEKGAGSWNSTHGFRKKSRGWSSNRRA